MKVTLAVDLSGDPPFVPEFGLSLILQKDEEFFLMDTGSGEALKQNLPLLDPEQKAAKRVILSHGHYDHTGGLKDLSPEKIYCCAGVLQSHYSYHADGTLHRISMPEEAVSVLKKTPLCLVKCSMQIAPGVFLLGPIPRVSAEACAGNFFHDEACTLKDTVEEELALFSEEGVLITGCCHAGLMNTILYCEKLFPSIVVRTVAGGLHLRNASEKHLSEVAEFLRERKIEKLVLMHCTGENAVSFLQKALSPACQVLTMKTGTTLEL